MNQTINATLNDDCRIHMHRTLMMDHIATGGTEHLFAINTRLECAGNSRIAVISSDEVSKFRGNFGHFRSS